MTAQQIEPTTSTPEEATPKALRSGSGAMVKCLYGLTGSPATKNSLMALRSSLGRREGYSPEAVPVVARFLPEWAVAERGGRAGRRNDLVRRGYYLSAGLFSLWHLNHAANEKADQHETIGRALARLSNSRKTQAEALIEGISRVPRVQAANNLLRAVTVLSQSSIRLDWYDLARALTGTDRDWTTAQRVWAETYYQHCKH